MTPEEIRADVERVWLKISMGWPWHSKSCDPVAFLFAARKRWCNEILEEAARSMECDDMVILLDNKDFAKHIRSLKE